MFGKQVPFRLELVAQAAAESGLKGGEEDGDRVVAGSGSEGFVGAVVEGHGFAGRALLRVILGEAVARGLLGAESGEGEEQGGEGGEEAHLVLFYGTWRSCLSINSGELGRASKVSIVQIGISADLPRQRWRCGGAGLVC